MADKAPAADLLPPAREERFTPALAFQKAVKAVERAGAQIDGALLSKETSPEERAAAHYSAELLKNGMKWACEEFVKSTEDSQFKTVDTRLRVIEMARRTQADYVKLVDRDKRETDIITERARLMGRLEGQIDLYLGFIVHGTNKRDAKQAMRRLAESAKPS